MREAFNIHGPNCNWSLPYVNQVLTDLNKRGSMSRVHFKTSAQYSYKGAPVWSIDLMDLGGYRVVFLDRDLELNKVYVAFVNPTLAVDLSVSYSDDYIYALDLDEIGEVSLAVGLYLTKARDRLYCYDWNLRQYLASYQDLFASDALKMKQWMLGFGTHILGIDADVLKPPYEVVAVSGD